MRKANLPDSFAEDSLGLESGIVAVVPYDPRWTDAFEHAAAELRQVVGQPLIAIHHVGSTAVPGLWAKPVLDILVLVPDFAGSLKSVAAIESLGYRFRPDEEIPDRHYFNRRRGTRSTHHLSLAQPDSRYSRVTLAFRDALRQNRSLAQEYRDLKLRLAREFPEDREKYIDGKTDFVAQVLREAGL